MAVGAASAVWWVAAGGSLVAAVAVYSGVSVAVILGLAGLAFARDARAAARQGPEGEVLRPADHPLS